METILDVRGVSKRYGRREVLREITFSAKKGEIIALLGRNGTGKSTLMNMMTGYLCQTGGEITVCGDDTLESPMKTRAHIGYLPEQPPLYPDMTVREYLHYCAQLRGMSHKQQKQETERVIELTGLNEYASRLSGRLSKGYRQRLGVAQALLPHPSLLILDEPGSGLDPLQMVQMRDVIRKAGEESTVLLSSHLLSEVTNVCRRAIVLDHGHICFDGTMTSLLQGAARIRLRYRGDDGLIALLSAIPGVTSVTDAECSEDGAAQLIIHHELHADLRAQVSACCLNNGYELLEMTSEGALEEAFLDVIGQKEEN